MWVGEGEEWRKGKGGGVEEREEWGRGREGRGRRGEEGGPLVLSRARLLIRNPYSVVWSLIVSRESLVVDP